MPKPNENYQCFLSLSENVGQKSDQIKKLFVAIDEAGWMVPKDQDVVVDLLRQHPRIVDIHLTLRYILPGDTIDPVDNADEA